MHVLFKCQNIKHNYTQYKNFTQIKINSFKTPMEENRDAIMYMKGTYILLVGIKRMVVGSG